MTTKELTITTPSMLLEPAAFEHAQRVARMLSSSSMVPEHFRGPENIGNTMIALNYAARVGADPFMVMQAMYVVHGRPGVEGKFLIALINTCGRFDPLQFSAEGDLTKPVDDDHGCMAWTKDRSTGIRLEGPRVTWGIVKAEGWYVKNQSKWKTMSPLMFRYRAASWFANLYCPEVKLGMQTAEELQDVIEIRPDAAGNWSAPAIDEGEMAAAANTTEAEPAQEPTPEKQKKGPSQTITKFLELTASMDQERLKSFVSSAARANDCADADIMADAVKNFREFSAMFKRYCDRPTPDTRKPGNTIGSTADNRPPDSQEQENTPPGGWDEWMKRWVNIHGKNFPAFVKSQEKWFRCAPLWAMEKAREKWGNLCDGPWPLDEPQQEAPAAETKTEIIGNAEADGMPN